MPYPRQYRKCDFPGCGRPHAAHGLCHGHLNQQKRGQMLHALKPRQPRGLSLEQVVGRLLAKARPEGECLVLYQRNDRDGYAHASWQGKVYKAHRLVLLAHAGPALDGSRCVLHSCHRPACINPHHLRWGSDADNSADAVAADRTAWGERSGAAKLTESDVREIRRLLKETNLLQREIAARFNVARSRIAHIKLGYDWKRTH